MFDAKQSTENWLHVNHQHQYNYVQIPNRMWRWYYRLSVFGLFEFKKFEFKKHFQAQHVKLELRVLTFETNYIKITEDKWKCVQCNKIMWSKYKKSHFEKTCKKVESPLQCEFCFVMCTNKDSKYRHRKICEQNPVNLRIWQINKT